VVGDLVIYFRKAPIKNNREEIFEDVLGNLLSGRAEAFLLDKSVLSLGLEFRPVRRHPVLASPVASECGYR
jgi:hypothetical protein